MESQDAYLVIIARICDELSCGQGKVHGRTGRRTDRRRQRQYPFGLKEQGSWSSVDRRCSNYIFILDLTPGFNGLGKGNCKTRRESFNFGDLVPLILQILRQILFFLAHLTLSSHPINESYHNVHFTLYNQGFIHHSKTNIFLNRR